MEKKLNIDPDVNIDSDALKDNIDQYRVEVTIDEKFAPLQTVMSQYFGITEGLNIFLTELSHPYRNWPFIIHEIRGYSLDYFHLFKSHPDGIKAAGLLVDIFVEAFKKVDDPAARVDAVDNFMLFLQKIIKDGGKKLSDFYPVINTALGHIADLPDKQFFLFVKGYYPINRLAESLLAATDETVFDFEPINRLTLKYYHRTYAHWLSEDDPKAWFERKVGTLPDTSAVNEWFKDISKDRIAELDKRLEKLTGKAALSDRQLPAQMSTFPGYAQIVEAYRQVPNTLLAGGKKNGSGNHRKVLFLFHIMNLSGLSALHEEVLREIDRTLSWLIDHEPSRHIRRLIEETFTILKARNRQFPLTVLSCFLNMGKGVYQTDERDLVNFFIDAIIDLGFEPPMIGAVGNDWQIKANSAHLQNIRTWLTIIERNPRWSVRLLSGLIIHLSLSGTFIKDTDLFFRDITQLLNSDIGPVFNLVKQLVRLFPIFFHDIGAEGELRDVSTQLDEMVQRKDMVVHFLRKQSHVESSSRTVILMEAVIRYWCTKDKNELGGLVPPDIFDHLETSGPYIDGVHLAIAGLEKEKVAIPAGLKNIDTQQLTQWLQAIPDITATDIQRVLLTVGFYKLLDQKYNLGSIRIEEHIEQLKTEGFPGLDRISQVLLEPDDKKKLQGLIEYLGTLKDIILSGEQYEIKEDVYKKRHFTVDIPSMYGRYHELKFDALGLMLRIESLVNVLFESLVQKADLTLITKATFFRIYDLLFLFGQVLKLDGVPTMEFERQLSFLSHSLKVQVFTFTQYLDIFKGFRQAVKNIFNDCFYNIHDQNLEKILDPVDPGVMLPKYRLFVDKSSNKETAKHQVFELFIRDRLATSQGLQQLDNFLSRIGRTLFHQLKELPDNRIYQLLLYDHERAITSIEEGGGFTRGIIHMGNKGYNLIKIKEFGMKVPPGFIITTEVFRCREIVNSYPPAKRNFAEQVMQHIQIVEEKTGRRYGDPEKPLLFSVRSGAAISQPGMMNTFLNVGMDEEIAEGLAELTDNPWFAWDNYRRFLQCYGMALGIERDHFDAIIQKRKALIGVPLKRYLSGDQMKALALEYKQSIATAGFKLDIIEDPMDQLFNVIEFVFQSWYSKRAKDYREIMGISEDWGTAVTVQAMAYGNRSRQSGSGVAFTHNPRWAGDTLRLWGDFTIGNQGEDVVSGLVNTLPISVTQQEVELRDTDIILETHFPDIYEALRKWAVALTEKHGWGPQEMEFTFEGPSADQLNLLQTREMTIRARKKVLAFVADDIRKEAYLDNGIGVSGGAMSGRIVFDLDEIGKWRNDEPETDLILLRNDTVPDDILEINAADGLLTARGGITSHAAVVAHRLNKTCVVGCDSLVCNESQKECYFDKKRIVSGDFISINGREGVVYKDRIRIKEESRTDEFNGRNAVEDPGT